MEKFKLISPVIYLKPNQCHICRGNLVLVEESRAIAKLDDNGYPNPMDYIEEEYEMKVVCSTCGKEYKADKKGPYFRIARTTPRVVSDKCIVKGYNPFYIN